jgi:hypothetical protein
VDSTEAVVAAAIVANFAFVLLSVTVPNLGILMNGVELRLVDVDVEAFLAGLKVPVLFDLELLDTFICVPGDRLLGFAVMLILLALILVLC